MTTTPTIEPWLHTWREGLTPCLERRHLLALRDALAADSQLVIHRYSVEPVPLPCMSDWPVEKACAVCYMGWKADNLTTVGEVEAFFARICAECDARLGEPSGVRHLLNAWDEWDRKTIRTALLAELERQLAQATEAA